MRYHDIKTGDMLNGMGIRVTLFVAGCNHYCKGCHNPITWDANEGLIFDEKAKQELFEELEKDYCKGVTFSGGDPLYPDNRADITALAKEVKEKFPEKDIWLYTGFTYEGIYNLEVMSYIDVLVDGEFKEELKDNNYHWAGSTNQRIIDVKESRRYGSIKGYK